jgi:rhamnose transport system permease protein
VTALRSYKRELSVSLVFALLLAILAWRRPDFFQPRNLVFLMTDAAPTQIVAVGMALVIIARQIDISVGSQLSICVVLAGLAGRAGFGAPVAALIAIGGGAAMGGLNAALVALMKLPSIVVTLATLVVFRQSLLWLGEGATIQGLPATFQWFGAGQAVGQWLVISTALFVLLLSMIFMAYVQAGRAVYATGSDFEAARLAGLRPTWVTFSVFVLLGALTGLAAALEAVRKDQLGPKVGDQLEMRVIAAAVVGGIAISGGRGRLIGCLIGVALLQTIAPALNYLGLKAEWEKAFQGLIILLSVASDSLERKHGLVARATK